MISFEKKIAQETLKLLEKKSWNKLSINDVIKNKKNKKFFQ